MPLDILSDDLFLEIECVDRLLIILRLVHTEVVEQLAAAGNLGQKSTASGVVFLVILEVLGHHRDFLGEDSNLHRWRTGVLVVCAVFADECLLRGTLERHKNRGNVVRGCTKCTR